MKNMSHPLRQQAFSFLNARVPGHTWCAERQRTHFVRRRKWRRVQTVDDERDHTFMPSEPPPNSSAVGDGNGSMQSAAWLSDGDVTKCMCCRKATFSLGTRRHHCRHCGRVVCDGYPTPCEAALLAGAMTAALPTSSH